MKPKQTRRRFLTVTGVGAAAAATSSLEVRGAEGQQPTKIIGVSCSLRAGKTTAQALRLCLEAAQAAAPDRIEIELIELAGLKIPTQVVVGLPLDPGERDDFPAVAEKLGAANVAGIIIGSPVYFANMTALCKAFLDRCGMFRKKSFALSGRVGGVVAVGGVRSGGQELVIQSIQASLFCHEMLVVGDGRPTGHFGARLWNDGSDDISKDEFGVSTAKNLGRHVAEVVLGRERA